MKLKLFQKQDLARAALKDGLILGWDTGMGKTWAMFIWPLLKVGFDLLMDSRNGERIRPNAPILIIAPGDLHQQICEEAMNHFKVAVHTLDSQEAFEELTRLPGQLLANTDAEGRPIVPPGFYITSYTQLATNGVAPIPYPYDWDPRALLAWLALGIGQHQETVIYSQCDRRNVELPAFADVCTLFAWRAIRWQDEYDLLNFTPSKTIEDLDRILQVKLDRLAFWEDKKAAENERKQLYKAYEVLQNLCTHTPNPKFSELNRRQQDWVIREFCAAKVAELSAGIGELKAYPIGPPPPGYIADKPETDTRPKRFVKCVFSPSLADLCWNAFAAVVIDEGVNYIPFQ